MLPPPSWEGRVMRVTPARDPSGAMSANRVVGVGVTRAWNPGASGSVSPPMISPVSSLRRMEKPFHASIGARTISTRSTGA